MMNIPISSYPGSRWWKFDFHTHTPASSDYGAGTDQSVLKARTCREWIGDFILAGIRCVAVTDHNCGEWIDPLKAELKKMREEKVLGSEEFFYFQEQSFRLVGFTILRFSTPPFPVKLFQIYSRWPDTTKTRSMLTATVRKQTSQRFAKKSLG